ncbi:REX4 [[Candida] subhashii]|uniref:RNA exonuclease 4 n=1 Tax=[Candida] subhashii TaxID=561895 RepID=A0A8J5Q1Y7_9ASCO|nr:REX4 [[Candida] subhashii]KAG7660704.1 REX4 [[Candida] subhashii]
MSALSSNWKKLSSKINKENGKVTKPKNKKTTNTKAKTKPDPPKKQAKYLVSVFKVPSETATIKKTVTPIEYALWTKENNISISDLPESLKAISLSPQGTDSRKKEPGKYIAIDCEFVGVGPEGEESALARISIVNYYGHVIFDEFVKPRERVTDWRTWVSGVSPRNMKDAISFEEAQKKTADVLEGKILVGHAVHHDLESLFLSHPHAMIRDTTQYPPFREIAGGRIPSLKKLAEHFLKIDIQGAAHSSVEDARATMLLFRLHKKDIEKHLRSKYGSRR